MVWISVWVLFLENAHRACSCTHPGREGRSERCPGADARLVDDEQYIIARRQNASMKEEVFAAAVAACAYLNAIYCAFVFDDTLAIVNNPDVKPNSKLSDIFAHDFWGKSIIAFDSHKSYRPLTILSFRAHTLSTYPPDPRSFHAVNIALHALVTGCMVKLAATLWPAASVSASSQRHVALLAGLLFAVHPVHVEAVTGTVGRAELLCALCCFASASAYAACAAPTAASRSTRLCLGLLAAMLFFTAVLCKETGVTLLGVLGVREAFVHVPRCLRRRRTGSGGDGDGEGRNPNGSNGRNSGCSLIAVLLRLVLLGSCAAGYALMRLLLMRPPGAPISFAAATLSSSELIRRAENPLAFVTDRWLWFLSCLRVNAEYVRLLVWPVRLCIEYSFDCIPMAKSYSLTDNAGPLLLLLLAVVSGMAALRNALWRGGGGDDRGGTRAKPRMAASTAASATTSAADTDGVMRRHSRHTVVAGAWLLMPWLPISHVPLRLGTLVAERTLYLPSVGAVLLLANALRPWMAHPHARHRRAGPDRQTSSSQGRQPDRKKAAVHVTRRQFRTGRFARSCLVASAVGLTVGALAVRTLRRSIDWRTDNAAFEAAILACPRSAKLHQQMCTLRTGQERLAEAAAHCAISSRIDPEFCDVHKSRGFLALAANDLGVAIAQFNASLPCPYTNLQSYRVLLSLYDMLHARDRRNATLYEAMASTHAYVGNAPYAAILSREACALHLKNGDATSALAAADAGVRYLQHGGGDGDGKGNGQGGGGGVASSPSAGGAVGAAGVQQREVSAEAEDAACALYYWRGQALLASKRRAKALEAFSQVGECPGHAPLAKAAAAEAALLREWRKGRRARKGVSASPASTSSADEPLPEDVVVPRPSTRRVLLLTFHGGVAASVRWAAKELGWALDAPSLDDSWLGGCDDDGDVERTRGARGANTINGAQPSAAYRFSEARAACLWSKHDLGARLAPYDLVIVGDTAPLAWPLLRAGWPEKYAHLRARWQGEGEEEAARAARERPPQRLLIWVCNRFDYGAVGDESWYDMIRSLSRRPAVSVLSSASFEWKYAQHVRRASFPSPAILPPSGRLASPDSPPTDPVPPSVDKPNTFFVLPKINEARMGLADALASRGVAVWTPGVWPSGMQRWGGPLAVAPFRAAIHIPYAPVTFALYEHAAAGLLTFVPSADLLLRLYARRGLFFQSTPTDFVTTGHGTSALSQRMLLSTDWYAADNAPCFVYFESLDDLQEKLQSTDYKRRRADLAAWAEAHVNSTLNRWRMIDRFLVRGDQVEEAEPDSAG